MPDQLQDTLLNRALSTGKDLATGFGKGIARMPLDAGHMVRTAPVIGPLVRKFSGDPDDKLYEDFRQSFNPEGTAQGVGYGAEKLGELALGTGNAGSIAGGTFKELLSGVGGVPTTPEQAMHVLSDIDYLARLAHGAYTKTAPAREALFEKPMLTHSEMLMTKGIK